MRRATSVWMLLHLGLAVACSGAGPMVRSEARAPTPAAAPTEADTPVAGEARVLVRSAALSVEVEKLAPAMAAATAFAARLGGYVESSVQRSEGSARLVLRVPSVTLDASLDTLAALGKVRSRSVSATDVTAEARDLEARVTTLRATRDRLRQLLERATSVADIAAIEAQLGRVQQDLDSLEGRLKSLRTDVALSPLTLDIDRRHVLGPLGYVAVGLAWVVEKLFVWR